MALKRGNSDSYPIWRSVSQLLKPLDTDETEQKTSDVEILCDRDFGLWVLKGTVLPSRCGCNFLTGTAFPLVPPEFKHCPVHQWVQVDALMQCRSCRIGLNVNGKLTISNETLALVQTLKFHTSAFLLIQNSQTSAALPFAADAFWSIPGAYTFRYSSHHVCTESGFKLVACRRI